MAFPAEVLEAGIAVANTLTAGVQGVIMHEACTGTDGEGNRTYATAVPLDAVIDYKRRQKPTLDGKILTIVATLTIVGDVAPNGATITGNPRLEPIDPRDRITLPNGFVGPILSTPGAVLNPNTGRGFINEIEIGELGSVR